MTGLFIMFLSILAGVFFGLSLSNRGRSREKYFGEMVAVIERLISDIGFSQRPIEDILCDSDVQNAGLKKNIDEYLMFLRGGDLVLSKGFLNKREHGLVDDFFRRLGTLDLQTQLGELGVRKEVFRQIYLGARERNLKLGSAYIKLGFLGGLLLGILLL